MPHDVEAACEARVIVGVVCNVVLTVRLRYSVNDPYAVRLWCRDRAGEAEWMLGRDLLRDGMGGLTGGGDVFVWPARGDGRDVVMVSLSSPDGQAVLSVDAEVIRSFLAQTAAVVQYGEECLDVDAELAILMGR